MSAPSPIFKLLCEPALISTIYNYLDLLDALHCNPTHAQPTSHYSLLQLRQSCTTLWYTLTPHFYNTRLWNLAIPLLVLTGGVDSAKQLGKQTSRGFAPLAISLPLNLRKWLLRWNSLVETWDVSPLCLQPTIAFDLSQVDGLFPNLQTLHLKWNSWLGKKPNVPEGLQGLLTQVLHTRAITHFKLECHMNNVVPLLLSSIQCPTLKTLWLTVHATSNSPLHRNWSSYLAAVTWLRHLAPSESIWSHETMLVVSVMPSLDTLEIVGRQFTDTETENGWIRHNSGVVHAGGCNGGWASRFELARQEWLVFSLGPAAFPHLRSLAIKVVRPDNWAVHLVGFVSKLSITGAVNRATNDWHPTLIHACGIESHSLAFCALSAANGRVEELDLCVADLVPGVVSGLRDMGPKGLLLRGWNGISSKEQETLLDAACKMAVDAHYLQPLRLQSL